MVSLEWINCLSGAVTSREAMKASSEFCEDIPIPKPPSLAGSAINFLSVSFGGGRPVRLGMKSDLKMLPSAFKMVTDRRDGAGEV